MAEAPTAKSRFTGHARGLRFHLNEQNPNDQRRNSRRLAVSSRHLKIRISGLSVSNFKFRYSDKAILFAPDRLNLFASSPGSGKVERQPKEWHYQTQPQQEAGMIFPFRVHP